MFKIDKDPEAVLDYTMSWEDWMEDGDSIDTFTYSIDPDDGDLAVDSDSIAADLTTLWLSGGVEGQTYRVSYFIETSDGREARKAVAVTIKVDYGE